MFEHLLRSIGGAVDQWLYLIAGGLAFAEAAVLIGMVLPGETALLVAGVFCNPAYGNLDLRLMIPIAVVAAIAGDSVGYGLGKRLGPPLRRSRLGLRVGEPRWAKVDGFLHRHGGKAVFLGRMTAVLRALMPSMAGMSGMRYMTFLAWNAAGGLIWAPGCVLLGYAFSRSLSAIGQTLTWAPLALFALVALVLVAVRLRQRRAGRAEIEKYEQASSTDRS